MQNRASQKTRQKYSVGPQKGSATNSAGADQTMYFSGPFLCTFYLTNTREDEFKQISDTITLLKNRINAIQELASADNSPNDRLDQIQP